MHPLGTWVTISLLKLRLGRLRRERAWVGLWLGSAGPSRRAASGASWPVEIFAALDVQKLPEEVLFCDDIVDVQSWGECRGEDEFAVGDASIVRYLGHRAPIVDVDLAREIAEAAEEDQS